MKIIAFPFPTPTMMEQSWPPLRVQQDLMACRIDAWPDNQRLDPGGAAGTPPPTKERGATMIQTVLYQMAP
jgi:hypothetical protein